MHSAGGVTTFAVAATPPTQPIVPPTVSIAIIGTDAVLAAAPATPVQLAHACLKAGFANVVPASWGDELIAAAVLRRLPQFGSGPAIQCSCPIVAHRLLTASGDLRPVLLPLVPPPVAAARYVRSLARPAQVRVTYIGACPGAADESIDIRMSPEALIAMLAERDIVVADQPEVFESIIPPDRRRFRSQPGGVPTAEALWTEFGARTLVELDGEDFVTEVAQHLLTGKNVLIDASTRLGCACSGATSGARNPRAAVLAHEPPRATGPIVEERTPVDLDLPIPAVSRTPIDVVAVTPATRSTQAATPVNGTDAVVAGKPLPRPSAPINEIRLPRLSTPVVPRSVLSGFPQARDLEGKALPRAYVARRRSSPRGVSVVVPPEEPLAPDGARTDGPTPAPSHLEPIVSVGTPVLPEPPATASPVPVVPSAVAEETTEPSPVIPDASPGAVTVPSGPGPAVESAGVVEAIVAVAPSPAASAAESPSPAPSVHTVSDPSFVERAAEARAREPEPSRPASPRTPPRSARPVPPIAASRPTNQPTPSPSFSRGQLALIILAVAAIAVCASTVVAVIVSRSVTASSVSGTPIR